MMTCLSLPQRNEQVIAQKTENNLLLLNMQDGNYFSLNEVGGRIWELCDGNRTVKLIIAALAQEYEVPADVLEADTLALLDELCSAQLIIEAGQSVSVSSSS